MAQNKTGLKTVEGAREKKKKPKKLIKLWQKEKKKKNEMMHWNVV